MYNYKPGQAVRVINIQVAVPGTAPVAAVADYFSELFAGLQDKELAEDDPFLLDWQYAPNGIGQYLTSGGPVWETFASHHKVILLGAEPEEGDAFSDSKDVYL